MQVKNEKTKKAVPETFFRPPPLSAPEDGAARILSQTVGKNFKEIA
jgi:hypothetical protein